MKKDLSVEDICTFIWGLEKKYTLLNWQVDDVYIWQVIRMQLYYALVQKTGVFKNPHPNAARSQRQKIAFIFKSLRAYFTRNPFCSSKAVPNILFPHQRKINGKDIYSEQLMAEMGGNILSVEPLQTAMPLSKTLDFYHVIAHIKTAFSLKKYKMEKSNQDKIIAIETEIRTAFQIDYDLKSVIFFQLLQFKNLYPIYHRLFKKNKTENVFVLVAYAKPHILAAAKDLNIKVIELQHGTITRYHLGYSYPGAPTLAYAPDKLLTFGKYWSDTTELPSNLNPVVIGSPYIKALGQEHKASKEKKTITFCSQGVIGEKLFDFALKTAKQLKDYKIYFNLHPSERLEDYQKLMRRKEKTDNFHLIYKEPNIFTLLAQSEYQAGVFSTTLFEGIALGTKVILIDMPGIEYMRPLYEKNDAVLVRTVTEFIDNFQKAPKLKNAAYYYADPVKEIRALL
ncbi:MAG: hypothetical protein ACTSXQ_06635 [Alphaproteobacteria bacterium]